MVYYNPEDEAPVYLNDVRIAIDIIENYIDIQVSFPDHPISPEKELTIAQKRQGLNELKNYLIEHRFEDELINLIDIFINRMNARAAQANPDSEAHKLFCNMRDAADEVSAYFL